MLKNTKSNLKSIVIPAKRSVSGNPAECKALNTTRCPIRSGMTRETGRSMVEMLGVLAVIGVLSVAGIAGYTNAMKKHRANEILNEASKRAVLVAAQAMTGKTGEISLSEFGNNTVSGVSFGANATIENNQITLTLSGDGLSDVCPQMIASAGDNSVMLIESDCSKITFNADMSHGVVSVPTSTPVDCSSDANACSGCQTCQDGVCKDDATQCSGGTCTNGSCSCSDGREMCGSAGCCASGKMCGSSNIYSGDYTCHDVSLACTKNSDCDSGKYCKITASDCKTFTSSTACRATSDSDLTPVSYNGKTFYAGPDMSWWAAENFCLAHGKKLASLGSLGLSRSYSYSAPCKTFLCYDKYWDESWTVESEGDCTSGNYECDEYGSNGPLYTAFNAAGVGNRNFFWTSNSYNSCIAFLVSVTSTGERVDNDFRNYDYYALCE